MRKQTVPVDEHRLGLLNNILSCVISYKAFTPETKRGSAEYGEYRDWKDFIDTGRIRKKHLSQINEFSRGTLQDGLKPYQKLLMPDWPNSAVTFICGVHLSQRVQIQKKLGKPLSFTGLIEHACPLKAFSKWISKKKTHPSTEEVNLIRLEAVVFMATFFECIHFDNPKSLPITECIADTHKLGEYREKLYEHKNPAGFSFYSVMRELHKDSPNEFYPSTLKRKMLGGFDKPFFNAFFRRYLSVYTKKDPKVSVFTKTNEEGRVELLSDLWFWLYLLDHAVNTCIDSGVAPKKLIPVLKQNKHFKNWYQQIMLSSPSE